MSKKSAIAYQEVQYTGRLNSDDYTLADFHDLESEDIFDKAVPHYHFIQDMKEKNYYSYQRPLLSPSKNRVIVHDYATGKAKEMIMMSSNNYLGLTTHPKVINAGIKAIEKYGMGPGSVPLLSGTFDITKQLEKKLAELKGCEDAIVFTSGYFANVGTLSAILRSNDIVIVDKLDHASIIDGCKLSGAEIEVFRHQDMERLERCLKAAQKKHKNPLVVVDGVYSMHGDICNLPDIKYLAEKYIARVMVDDAHATGVIGKHGRGTADHFGMEGKIDLTIGTLSKALGLTGGFIASSKEVIEYIRFYSRSFFFSTSLPPHICASAIAAIEVLNEEPERREQLRNNVLYLHSKLSSMGLQVNSPDSGILTVLIGNDLLLRKMSRRIDEFGLYINPVPFPAVPKGQSRFRISLMATHTKEDLDFAAEIIESVCSEFNLLKPPVHTLAG